MMRSPDPFIFLEERGVAGYFAAIALKALEWVSQLAAEHFMIKRHIIKLLLEFGLLIL
ncbi:hypothetical protein [Microcoleus sp. M2_D2]|uniref:hypothetical protein n=1 Tax=Microcoleus sp. M2_D2 TaxID=3055374 RepID=UPI002FD14AC7